MPFFLALMEFLTLLITSTMKTANIRKTYELLKTSWTYQTREYFNNSTLHGVQYIREEGRPFYEK
jgi:amiloride-sensitive sodium channel